MADSQINEAKRNIRALSADPLKTIVETILENKIDEAKTTFLLGTHKIVGEYSSVRTLTNSEIFDRENIKDIFQYAGLTFIRPSSTVLDHADDNNNFS